MRKVLVVLALLCAGLEHSHAQERTAGSAMETQMTWTALKGMVDGMRLQATAASLAADDARKRASKLEICNKKMMLYAPDADGADADGCKSVFDPKELTIRTGSVAIRCGDYGCSPDDRTTEHLCIMGGYSYPTGLSFRSFSSPKNDTLARWTGVGWQAFGAREDNRLLTSLTCQIITFK